MKVSVHEQVYVYIIFLYLTVHDVHTCSGASRAPSQAGVLAIFTGLRRPPSECAHITPSSAEVKNAWHCTSIHQYVLMA
jgi:hypothetical protein